MDASPHPLQAMVSDKDSNKPADHRSTFDTEVQKPEAPRHIKITDQSSSGSSSIWLSGIKYPALLVTTDLEIAWQNKDAVEKIWQNAGPANNGNPTPLLLDLIFDVSFKRQIADFSGCLTFFLNQLRGLLSEDELRDRIARMQEDRQTTLLSLLEQQVEHGAQSNVYGGYFRQALRGGSHNTYAVVAFNCDEGRLLVFEPRPDNKSDHLQPTPNVNDRFERIRRQPNPLRTPYFLLAAHINQASTLRTEMLADEHWRLINGLCHKCLLRIEQYGGVFGRHIESGFFAYFLPDHNLEADAMRVIECALEVKSEAIDLGRQWKVRKNWLNNIDLNIGIHYEKAYVGTMPVSSGEILTSFGEGLHVAGAISKMANEGQVWATKPVINQIPTASCEALRFGILRPGNHQHHAFVRNGFAAIRELFGSKVSGGPFEDELSYLPITQIFDMSGRDM